MQDRTKLILKGCGIFSGILASAMAITLVYDRVAAFDKFSGISGAEWFSILGGGMIALASVFAAAFLMFALFSLVFVGIAQYIYDRIYRTPTL